MRGALQLIVTNYQNIHCPCFLSHLECQGMSKPSSSEACFAHGGFFSSLALHGISSEEDLKWEFITANHAHLRHLVVTGKSSRVKA